jgi:hypothetical protein
MTLLRRVLWLVVLLSLIPAIILVVKRVHTEGDSRTVTILLDESDLADQADLLGITPLELGQRYREAGLNGISFYEETLESLEATGRIALATGAELRSRAASQGQAPPDLPADSTLATALVPGALQDAIAKNYPPAKKVVLNGVTWYMWPGDGRLRPAGPDLPQIKKWADAGWDIAYRPRNYPKLQHVGADFPQVASYLINAGTEVAGSPDALKAYVTAAQPYLTGLIEGTHQDGMSEILSKIPSARVFSIAKNWQDTLSPGEVVDKYLLATNERGARLLYLHTYDTGQMGNMFDNTERLIHGLKTGLTADDFTVAPVRKTELAYHPSALLRLLCIIGVLAGLGLLATLYPAGWGIVVALLVFALGVVAGHGFSWSAFTLMAALTFPVLGYGLLPERIVSLGVATLISLIGATLLAAIGSDRATMLAAQPFAGVAAVLLVPPVLFIFQYMLRYRRPARWVADFWGYRVRLGDVILVVIGLAAVALIFLRRGNFPVIGVSSAELSIRQWLSNLFVRPRFKELLGHPMAVLGLGNGTWPAWIRCFLLTGGGVAQARIMDTFSHYHTPFVISLERTLIGLVLGAIIGLILLPIVRGLVRLIRGWLKGAKLARQA